MLVPGIALARDMTRDMNRPVGGIAEVVPEAAGASQLANQGHFVCSAAIHFNGVVFSGQYVDASETFGGTGSSLGVGTYQVAFNPSGATPCHNVTISYGFFRVCQIDASIEEPGGGTRPAGSCTVADRAGVPNAIWVQTFNASGALADTPFTLQVSR
jgi:hypothetical protein